MALEILSREGRLETRSKQLTSLSFGILDWLFLIGFLAVLGHLTVFLRLLPSHPLRIFHHLPASLPKRRYRR
ncbi:hypothetical protein C8J56DRAFT_1027182, partial [Mycena floridula]